MGFRKLWGCTPNPSPLHEFAQFLGCETTHNAKTCLSAYIHTSMGYVMHFHTPTPAYGPAYLLRIPCSIPYSVPFRVPFHILLRFNKYIVPSNVSFHFVVTFHVPVNYLFRSKFCVPFDIIVLSFCIFHFIIYSVQCSVPFSVLFHAVSLNIIFSVIICSSRSSIPYSVPFHSVFRSIPCSVPCSELESEIRNVYW